MGGKYLFYRMRRIILVIILFSSFLYVKAQPVANADSLLKLLSVAKEDTARVLLLHSIADVYEMSEPEKAKTYVRQAGVLSKQLNFELGIMKHLRHMAYIHTFQANYDSMLFFNEEVLEIATIKKDTFNIGVSLFNIGESYKFKADYEKGVEYTLNAVKMLQGKGYSNIEANLYAGLLGTYVMLKQYDKAIGYGLKAIELGRKMEDKNIVIGAMVNLANAYGEVKKIPEAKKLYAEAVSIAKSLNSIGVEAMAYEGLGDIALLEENYELQREYAEKAIALHTQIQNGYGLAAAHQSLAVYYLYKQDNAKAKKHALEALRIAEESDNIETKAEVLATLSAIALSAHEFSEAFKLGRESEAIKEKIFSESVADKDAQLRVKYETEKKDTQLQLQQATIRQKNTLNYILIGSAAALLIISLLGYRNYRHNQKLQQQRINELETEKQLTATEAVLKGEEQERTRLAKDLHDGLGGMLSGIKYSFQTMKGNLIMTPENHQAFERSMDMLDSSIKEMRRVAHNMMPEALVKFGLNTALKDFCNDINQSGAVQVNYQSIGLENEIVDQTTAIAIYRIVQELINNVMKHAGAANAIVQVSKTGDNIAITVEDDGKGFDTVVLQKAKGIGWSNIVNRIEFLKGKLDVQSTPGKGTSVLIELQA